jgi:hypothetical protein
MEVKVTSRARPLHIERSVEGPALSPVALHNATTTTAPSTRKSDFYNEEIESLTNVNLFGTQSGHGTQSSHVTKSGSGQLTVSELFANCNVVYVVGFALFIVLATLFCILTEEDISLAYVLPSISLICIALFLFLKL